MQRRYCWCWISKKCNRMLNYTVQYMQRRCCWCWITQTFGAMPLTIWLEVGEKNFDAITDALVSFQSSVLLSSSSALLSPSWSRISKRLTQSVWLLCLWCFCTFYEKGVNILGEKRPIFQAFQWMDTYLDEGIPMLTECPWVHILTEVGQKV